MNITELSAAFDKFLGSIEQLQVDRTEVTQAEEALGVAEANLAEQQADIDGARTSITDAQVALTEGINSIVETLLNG